MAQSQKDRAECNDFDIVNRVTSDDDCSGAADPHADCSWRQTASEAASAFGLLRAEQRNLLGQ